jgi:hypothetical protein
MLKNTLLEENNKREKNLGSAIFQCLNSISRKYFENAFKIGLKDELFISHSDDYFEGFG